MFSTFLNSQIKEKELKVRTIYITLHTYTYGNKKQVPIFFKKMKMAITCIITLLVIQEVAIYQNSLTKKASFGIGMWPLAVSAQRRQPTRRPPPTPTPAKAVNVRPLLLVPPPL